MIFPFSNTSLSYPSTFSSLTSYTIFLSCSSVYKSLNSYDQLVSSLTNFLSNSLPLAYKYTVILSGLKPSRLLSSTHVLVPLIVVFSISKIFSVTVDLLLYTLSVSEPFLIFDLIL